MTLVAASAGLAEVASTAAVPVLASEKTSGGTCGNTRHRRHGPHGVAWCREKTEVHEANHPDAEHWIADLVVNGAVTGEGG